MYMRFHMLWAVGYTWFFLNVELTLARGSNKPLLLWQPSCASVFCRVSCRVAGRSQAHDDVRRACAPGGGRMGACDGMRAHCVSLSLCNILVRVSACRTSLALSTWRIRVRDYERRAAQSSDTAPSRRTVRPRDGVRWRRGVPAGPCSRPSGVRWSCSDDGTW